MKRLSKSVTAGVCAIALLNACMLGPDYQRPELGLPTAYMTPAESGEGIANLQWWDIFKDPTLQQLVRTALAENKDLQIAMARIEASRALLGMTKADLLPRIDGSASADRADASDELFLFDLKPRNNFGLFGNLSYELDIWGKLRRATEAQRAELLASEYGYRAVTTALVAEVASTYLAILGIDDRIAISQDTLKNRKGATNIISARFQKGIVPQLDVNQAEYEEADAAIALTEYERQSRQLQNALSVLLGRAPFAIPRGVGLQKVILFPQVPAGFPAALLERRPDVRAAEERVKALVARVGVAQSEQLPSLNLLGFVGLESAKTNDLMHRKAFTWGIGGDLVGPLLDWGKSASNVDLAKAEADAGYKQYERTVLTAVQEVEDELIAVDTYRREHRQRSGQVSSAGNASRLSRARYDDGVTSYLEVLDNDRSLFQARLGESSALQQYFVSIIRLYKALGGGWTEEPAKT